MILIACFLSAIIMGMVGFIGSEKEVSDTKRAICVLITGVILIFLFLDVTALEDKNLCDNQNPYYKEYVYKQLPSGQYVKTDSVYVRTKGR